MRFWIKVVVLTMIAFASTSVSTLARDYRSLQDAGHRLDVCAAAAALEREKDGSIDAQTWGHYMTSASDCAEAFHRFERDGGGLLVHKN